MKEVVPTHSAEREKLKEVHTWISFCCFCSGHILSSDLQSVIIWGMRVQIKKRQNQRLLGTDQRISS